MRNPRRLLGLFVAVGLLPVAGLIWLGTRLFDAERVLAEQRLRDGLGLAIDGIASDIRRDLERIGPADVTLETADAVLVSLAPNGVRSRTGAPLLFVPMREMVDTHADTWTALEALEATNTDMAVARYHALATSTERSIRAGALIRLARVFRSRASPQRALDTYGQLATFDDVPGVLGEPASLVAALARVRLLDELKRTDQRNAEAARVREDLERGRWPIDQVTFSAAWSQVAPQSEVAGAGALLATCVETLWRQWRINGTLACPEFAGVFRAVTMNDEELVAVVTAPSFLARRWRSSWEARGLAVSMLDTHGRFLGGTNAHPDPVVTRTALETGLPWTLRVASLAPQAELAKLTGRRDLLFGVFGLAAFLVITGTYFISRAVQRELAVARLQSEFVSAVSHEFRTPLTSMSHLIELLRSGRSIDDHRRGRYYDALDQEASRLRALIDRLLDFGRLESGAMKYDLVPEPAGVLVSSVVDQFRTEPSGRSRSVELTVDPAAGSVLVDRRAFDLALRNLLENAAKYSPESSPIHVEVSGVEGAIAFRVHDQGVGIPPEEQTRIFDKFVRGASARESGIRGTGVGLALARQIVRAHGGDVSVSSAPGRGSTFTISLPAIQPG